MNSGSCSQISSSCNCPIDNEKALTSGWSAWLKNVFALKELCHEIQPN